MTVRVNGEARELPPGATVADLLERFGLAGVRLAVEQNRAIVPRDRHASTVLAEGDDLEIVTFVGGG